LFPSSASLLSKVLLLVKQNYLEDKGASSTHAIPACAKLQIPHIVPT
jgi:hypothetical protein